MIINLLKFHLAATFMDDFINKAGPNWATPSIFHYHAEVDLMKPFNISPSLFLVMTRDQVSYRIQMVHMAAWHLSKPLALAVDN